MTTEAARKKLGKRAENLSDQQITDIINFLVRLADRVIDEVVARKK